MYVLENQLAKYVQGVAVEVGVQLLASMHAILTALAGIVELYVEQVQPEHVIQIAELVV